MSVWGFAGDGVSEQRTIFISYNHVDDKPVSDDPDTGYVRFLRRQLAWKIEQLGVKADLWRDREDIPPGNIWDNTIEDALRRSDLFIAIISKNYILSEYCRKEFVIMHEKLLQESGTVPDGRIFRVDKNSVRELAPPLDLLSSVQAVQLYELDPSSTVETEYYDWGELIEKQKYRRCMNLLASAIVKQLEALGIKVAAPPPTISIAKPQKNQVVFLAAPARDVSREYDRLARELTLAGYKVVPNPESDLPKDINEACELIQSSLAQAEFSIHLLGEDSGVALHAEFARFQLQAAADLADRHPSFYRFIWAPKVFRMQADRKPHEVRDRFAAALASDQLDGDTIENFKQFVLQRLEAHPTHAPAIYVHYADGDAEFAAETAKRLKAMGQKPILREPKADRPADDVALRQIQAVETSVLCWRCAPKKDVLTEINGAVLSRWREALPDRRSILLLIGPPADDAKTLMLEFPDPSLTRVVDLTASQDLEPELFATKG